MTATSEYSRLNPKPCSAQSCPFRSETKLVTLISGGFSIWRCWGFRVSHAEDCGARVFSKQEVRERLLLALARAGQPGPEGLHQAPVLGPALPPEE